VGEINRIALILESDYSEVKILGKFRVPSNYIFIVKRRMQITERDEFGNKSKQAKFIVVSSKGLKFGIIGSDSFRTEDYEVEEEKDLVFA